MIAIAWFLLILILAFLVESFVEAFLGEVMGLSTNQTFLKWKPYILRYVASAIGVGLAFFYRLDLISLTWSLLAEETQLTLPTLEASWVGYIFTGLGIGRGSAWLHDFMKKWIPGLGKRLGGT